MESKKKIRKSMLAMELPIIGGVLLTVVIPGGITKYQVTQLELNHITSI